VQFEDNINKVDKILEGVGDLMMCMRNQIFTRQALVMLGFPRVNSSVALRADAVACLQRQGRQVPQTVKRRAPVPERARSVLGIGSREARPSSSGQR